VSIVVFVVSVVALVVAAVGVVAGLGVFLYEAGALGTKVIGANGAANLGVASILSSLIAVPIGFVGWRWAARRGQESGLGKTATLVGVGTFGSWFVLVVYALGRDTP
jgi:hypothetical protein